MANRNIRLCCRRICFQGNREVQRLKTTGRTKQALWSQEKHHLSPCRLRTCWGWNRCRRSLQGRRMQWKACYALYGRPRKINGIKDTAVPWKIGRVAKRHSQPRGPSKRKARSWLWPRCLDWLEKGSPKRRRLGSLGRLEKRGNTQSNDGHAGHLNSRAE